MKRTSVALAASLSAALLTACGGSKSLPFSVAPGGSPAGTVHKFATLHVTFHFTGAPQSFTVPQGVTHLHIIASGAAGGGDAGGPGGTTDTRISVHPDQVLGIFVGGKGSPQADKKGGAGGYNGGGNGANVRICTPKDSCWGGGGGGGASDVRDGGEHAGLNARLLVAGGGGGESAANVGWWAGGDGGGDSGGNGGAYYEEYKGHGGTQKAGGVGGSGGECLFGDPNGKDGTLGDGGPGGIECTRGRTAWSGGGGGGGYYGGGGGSGNSGEFCVFCAYPYNGAGGGGSGFVVAGGTDVKMLPSVNRDDGYIDIITEP
jgi:hypothetical protein